MMNFAKEEDLLTLRKNQHSPSFLPLRSIDDDRGVKEKANQLSSQPSGENW